MIQPSLPGWEKAPVRLLHLKDELAVASPPGWRPNRLILQTYWLCGYEEFHFVQGRLVLRGANGSGKSTVLVSAITLILDMEKRRERLDTFGGQGRGAAYYLIGTPDATPESDFYYFERTGYVALEFIDRDGRFFTIGVGLYTTRHRPDQSVDAWGFVIIDKRRIGTDFHLYDAAMLPLSARALREKLGAGGQVFDRSSEYQARVNASLFGLETAAEYDFLLSLLLQLRSPKLNKDTRPSDIRAMLAASLPPLPADLLGQAVQIIEDIDVCLERLEETEAQHQAIVAVDDRQALYLNQLAQREAVAYLVADRSLQEARQAEGRARDRLAEAETALRDTQELLARNNTAEQQARGRLDALESHEALRGQQALEVVAGDLEKARITWQTATESRKQSLAALERAELRRQDQSSRWQEFRQGVQQQVATLKSVAEEAAWPLARMQAEQMEKAGAELPPQPPPEDRLLQTLALPVISSAAGERERALRQAQAALQAEEQAQSQHQLALAGVERERSALAEAGQLLAKAEIDLAARQQEAAEAITSWRAWCQTAQVAEAALEQALLLLADFAPEHEMGRLRQVRQPLVEQLAGQRQQWNDQAARVLVERRRREEERDELRHQLAEWEGEKDPAPPRRSGQEEARRLLTQHGIPAIPLYASCEFVSTLSQEAAAQLEQTLEEAGVLDALVVPADAAEQVAAILESAGLGDHWLRPVVGFSAGRGGPDYPLHVAPAGLAAARVDSLLTVLQPVDGHPAAGDIKAALAGIAWFAFSAALDASDTPYAVAPGAWRWGALAGRAERRPDPVVIYVGEANRRRRREALIAELKEQIQRIDAVIWDLTDKLDNVRKQLNQLQLEQEALESLPAWDALWAAARDVQAAKRQVTRCASALREAEAGANREYQALLAARAELQQVLADTPEARGRNREGIAALINDTRRCVDQWRQAERLAASLARLRSDFAQALVELAAAQARLRSDEAALATAGNHVEELAARHAAMLEHLQQLGVDIVALHREIGELKSTLDRLRQESNQLLSRRGKAENDVVHATQTLEQAAHELQARRDAEIAQRQLFAQQLQAYPTLAKHLAMFDTPETGPRTAAADLLRARRTDEAHLQEAVEKGLREALQQLTMEMSATRSILAEYGPELLDGLVTFREMGAVIPPYRLRQKLHDDLTIQRQVLREKESELYENIILREIARHIRERIALAQHWCDKVNSLLTGRQLSNGEVLSIQWRPCPPDRLTGYDPSRVVALLRRDVEILTDAEVTELVEHFRQRVGEVRLRYKQNTLGEQTFALALEEALDYRNWFEFHLHSKLPGEERKELTDMRFAARSGGEKSLAMFIPILAAVHARYKAASPDAPRLIGLDEAFAGVDDHNIGEMFRFLVELDFSWIMTSEKLWGVGAALPGCSTYELVKGSGGVVTPVWFVWDGRRLVDGLTTGDNGAVADGVGGE